MKKYWLLVIGLVSVLALLFSGCSTNTTLGGVSVGQQEGIWVNGTGKVTAVPDVALLGLGVEAQKASVAEAQSEASQAMDKVMTTLKTSGVADKDIQTQQYSIYQVTRWDETKGEEIVVGYRVTNIVTAKIRTMDKIGIIIDAVAVAGGDLTRINSVAFSIDDPSNYQQQARVKAVADAQAKAKQLADLAGVTLGELTYVSESVQLPSPIYSGVIAEQALAPTPISPGEMEVSITVQTAYAITK